MKHGTLNAYKNLGCRCARCREANRLACLEFRRSRGVLPQAARAARRRAAVRHGSVTKYRHGCRCAECRRWVADDRARFRGGRQGEYKPRKPS